MRAHARKALRACTRRQGVKQSGWDVIRPKWPKNASLLVSPFLFGHSKWLIFVKNSDDGLTGVTGDTSYSHQGFFTIEFNWLGESTKYISEDTVTAPPNLSFYFFVEFVHLWASHRHWPRSATPSSSCYLGVKQEAWASVQSVHCHIFLRQSSYFQHLKRENVSNWCYVGLKTCPLFSFHLPQINPKAIKVLGGPPFSFMKKYAHHLRGLLKLNKSMMVKFS